MLKKKKISLIGTGALGCALAKALHQNDFPVVGLFNRSEKPLQALVDEIEPPQWRSFPASISEVGELCFITVPDTQIAGVAKQLSDLTEDFTGRMVVHCSGSKTSNELSALQEKGALTAAFHPLQTFTASSKPEDLAGIWFDLEGDRQAVSYLNELAKLLGSQCMEITPKAKPYLHAAAVTASNYLVALLESASTIAEMCGLESYEVRRALLPLVTQTLENSADSIELSGALSGPIARGDVDTVKKHLELLEPKPEILALYKQLGLQALNLAGKGGKISDDRYRELAKLLES